MASQPPPPSSPDALDTAIRRLSPESRAILAQLLESLDHRLSHATKPTRDRPRRTLPQ